MANMDGVCLEPRPVPQGLGKDLQPGSRGAPTGKQEANSAGREVEPAGPLQSFLPGRHTLKCTAETHIKILVSVLAFVNLG